MGVTLEVSTTNYADDKLAVKLAMSHLETLVGSINGYLLSEPSEKFGWTFFKIALQEELQTAIEKKFADMLDKYRWSNPTEKFSKFMTDYFASKGCSVKVKAISV